MTNSAQFYLHGLPGSEAELDFALPGWKQNCDLKALDRLTLDDEHEFAIETMAAQIANFESVHLIAFSLGAMSALKLAARMPDTVTKLDLIAPAAPLELGDYLNDMAGKPIFEAARDGGRLRILSFVQGVIAKTAPSILIRAIFANAVPADKALLDDDCMRIMLRDGLRHCLFKHQAAYKSELRSYVSPWLRILDNINCPVSIWHGQADNWTPAESSKALCKRLGAKASLTEFENLSHYSTLKAVLPNIVR